MKYNHSQLGMELETTVTQEKDSYESINSDKSERDRLNHKLGELENLIATEGESRHIIFISISQFSRRKIESVIEEILLKLKS